MVCSVRDAPGLYQDLAPRARAVRGCRDNSWTAFGAFLTIYHCIEPNIATERWTSQRATDLFLMITNVDGVANLQTKATWLFRNRIVFECWICSQEAMCVRANLFTL